MKATIYDPIIILILIYLFQRFSKNGVSTFLKNCNLWTSGESKSPYFPDFHLYSSPVFYLHVKASPRGGLGGVNLGFQSGHF